MHSTSKYYAFTLGYVILRTLEVGDYEHFKIITRKRFAKRCSTQYLLAGWLLAYWIEEPMAVCVRVRVAHGDVDVVIIMLQWKFKTQRVKIRRLFLIDSNNLTGSLRELSASRSVAQLLAVYLAQRLVVLVVCYVIAGAIPSHVVFVCFSLWIEQRHHAIIELRVTLNKVYYMERVFPVPSRVRYFEIEPLGEVLRAIVRFQDELVLILVYLYSLLQVARFEAWFEEEYVINYWWIASVIGTIGSWLGSGRIVVAMLVVFSSCGWAAVEFVPRVECFEISVLGLQARVVDGSTVDLRFEQADLFLVVQVILLVLVVRWVTIDVIYGLCKVYDAICVTHFVVVDYCMLQHRGNLVRPLVVVCVTDVLGWIKQERLLNASTWDHALRCHDGCRSWGRWLQCSSHHGTYASSFLTLLLFHLIIIRLFLTQSARFWSTLYKQTVQAGAGLFRPIIGSNSLFIASVRLIITALLVQ